MSSMLYFSSTLLYSFFFSMKKLLSTYFDGFFLMLAIDRYNTWVYAHLWFIIYYPVWQVLYVGMCNSIYRKAMCVCVYVYNICSNI